MPGTPDLIRKSGSASTYHRIATASTNAVSIKASPGVVTGYYLVNTTVSYRYVKLYNKASAPTVGTDTPLLTLGLPPQAAANINWDPPIAFPTGIALAIVAGVADSDATAVGANDVAVNLFYL